MDEIDRAAEAEEWYRSQALDAQAAQAARLTMLPVGSCYNCESVISVGCFCDKNCRDDYELRTKQQKQRV